MERTCLNCGCTDNRSCVIGCYWVLVHQTAPLGVCSECQSDVTLDDLEAAAARWQRRQSGRRAKKKTRRKVA